MKFLKISITARYNPLSFDVSTILLIETITKQVDL